MSEKVKDTITITRYNTGAVVQSDKVEEFIVKFNEKAVVNRLLMDIAYRLEVAVPKDKILWVEPSFVTKEEFAKRSAELMNPTPPPTPDAPAQLPLPFEEPDNKVVSITKKRKAKM